MTDSVKIETSASSQSAKDQLAPLLQELRGLDRSAYPVDFLVEFAEAYHFRTPPAYLARKSSLELVDEILLTYQLMERRKPEEIRVRVLQQPSAKPALLQTNMSDQPFILDTVLEILRASEIQTRSYLHPILQVERDPEHRMTAVRPRTAPGSHESVLFFELQPLRDEAACRALEMEVRESLLDARRAVEDFYLMKRQVDSIVREIQTYPALHAAEKQDMQEAAELLRWLQADNFVLLGYRFYRFFQMGGELHVQAAPGSGLGILRDETGSAFMNPVPVSQINESLQARLRLRIFPLISKTNRVSRVHRRISMDYIGIKQVNAEGEIAGEHRILGLLTVEALNQMGSEIPVLRQKLKNILERAQVLEGSHDYKRIIAVFNSIPKAELFSSSDEVIGQSIEEIIALQKENEVRVSCRPDLLGRGASVMVIIPRDRFNSTARRRIQTALSGRFGSPAADYRLALSDEPYARMHFYFTDESGKLRIPRLSDLESLVVEAIRTWEDEFLEQLMRAHGAEAGARLAQRYAPLLPEAYRTVISPENAAADVELFEKVRAAGRMQIAIQRDASPPGKEATEIRLFRAGEKFLLSEIMPVLANLGMLVIDESTFAVQGSEVPLCHLHAIRVKKRDGQPVPAERWPLLSEAILAVLDGQYENDALNELVVTAQLTVRQVELIRTYVHYFRQIGAPYFRASIASALSAHAPLTGHLIQYFLAKFDPALEPKDPRQRLAGPLKEIRDRIAGGLDKITDLNEDRIIRGLFGLMEATARTNYFQKGGLLPHLAIKIESRKIPFMPRPVPLFEIFVHNAEMEGIHLRSGMVARGGIRWSDRRDDFRTEILGLMRTQVTKNAIIVPVGSKGGFVLKRAPESRDQIAAEVERQYRTLISGMLDLTDNRAGGKICHPPEAVIYDLPDPYLVVAADKGTASFSDVANQIAKDYGFWLGDAFASGGSRGYDHKKHGITARGVWECVRRHFRELGIDMDKQAFTVAGIGDMSGDVFGNAMMLSRNIKLVAAFDHRHIFIDPDPDPKPSFEERARLFKLPRSSWADYRLELILKGGGIFPRLSKSIPLSPEMRKFLGTEDESMTGEEMVKAVLRLPVDLLYNGGIGTYVKASHESHADARDDKNDAVRVDASELRCKVVGEGGNLGFTQAARVEFAKSGGHIHTDFIDNSGGVDLSDHEVNIKIALAGLMRQGRMDEARRNRLLEQIASAVCGLVVATNRSQAQILSLEEGFSRANVSEHLDLLEDLQYAGILDPHLDRFPDDPELARRAEKGLGLLKPELATLLAFSKIETSRALRESDLLDALGFESYLPSYFPPAVIECCGEVLREHPLRREIAVTVFTNELVHRCGITFVSRLRRDLGCSIAEVARAYRVADGLIEGSEFFKQVEALMDAGALALGAGSGLMQSYRDAVADIACWLVRSWPSGSGGQPLAVVAVIEEMRPWFQRTSTWLEQEAPEHARRRFAARRDEIAAAGAPVPLADRAARFDFQREIPPLVPIALQSGIAPEKVADLYSAIRDALGMPQVMSALSKLPATAPDDRSAARALKEELRTLTLKLTERIAAACLDGGDCGKLVGQFFYDNWPAVEPYRKLIEAAERGRPWTLSSMIVLSERLRRLVAQSPRGEG
ncbi:MAG: NAD-glutamate dehydrogenase [Planctomycetes bacterium]|nr:NAD-glutamate dehydrogenase [Planctomycetota bacterium]